jgi:hypothetical protein
VEVLDVAFEVEDTKVFLTLDRNAGRIPGSGSSSKGFGKVVRPLAGDDLVFAVFVEGGGSEFTMCADWPGISLQG